MAACWLKFVEVDGEEEEQEFSSGEARKLKMTAILR